MRRRGLLWATVEIIIVVALFAIGGLAINAGSGSQRWPGWLDLVRRHPWPTIAIMILGLIVLEVRTRLVTTSPDENAVGEWRSRLARRVIREEQVQRALLLGGDTAAADIHFERQLIQFRTDGGHAAGTFDTILEYYETLTSGRMLILGDAGAGKTVLLLELLVRTLRERPNSPIPIRLPLSSWDGTNLESWVARSIARTYEIPVNVAHTLVEHREVLPLLDGMDEVDGIFGRRAIQVIDQANSFLDGNRRASLVVTCRPDFWAKAVHAFGRPALLDSTSIRIVPLDIHQVDEFGMRRLTRLDQAPVWDDILAHVRMRPTSPIGAAVTNPWRLTLAWSFLFSGERNPYEAWQMLAAASSISAIDDLLMPAFVRSAARAYGHYNPEAVLGWLQTVATTPRPRSWSNIDDLTTYAISRRAGELLIRRLNLASNCAIVVLSSVALVAFWRATGPADTGLMAAAWSLLLPIVPTTLLAISRAREPWRWPPPVESVGSSASDMDTPWPMGCWVGCSAVLALVTVPLVAVIARFLSPMFDAPHSLGLTWSVSLCWAIFILGLGMMMGIDEKFPNHAAFWTFRMYIRDELASGVQTGWLSFSLIAAILVAGPAGLPYATAVWGVAGATNFLSRQTTFTRYGLGLILSWWKGATPLRLRRFFGWCCTAGLMRRAGTDYEFRHLNLGEWLARDSR